MSRHLSRPLACLFLSLAGAVALSAPDAFAVPDRGLPAPNLPSVVECYRHYAYYTAEYHRLREAWEDAAAGNAPVDEILRTHDHKEYASICRRVWYWAWIHQRDDGERYAARDQIIRWAGWRLYSQGLAPIRPPYPRSEQ